MWWNPFYNINVNNDEIYIVNHFTNQNKFKIKSSDIIGFKKKILEPLMNESVSLDEFLERFPEQTKGRLKKLILQFEYVILPNKKQFYFYQHLFKVIKRVSIDFPGLDIDRIVNYMEETLLFADALILVDNQKYSEQEICSIFPFEHIDIIKLEGNLKDVSEQKIRNLRRKDWIIFFVQNLNNDIICGIERSIMENNRTLFLVETNLSKNKITFGPILIPRCTGGINQVLQKKYLEKIISFPEDIVIDSKESIEKDMLSEYVYDEILKFTIDKYSSYATEYSKLLGAQYEIDYKEKKVKQREFIISDDWL